MWTRTPSSSRWDLLEVFEVSELLRDWAGSVRSVRSKRSGWISQNFQRIRRASSKFLQNQAGLVTTFWRVGGIGFKSFRNDRDFFLFFFSRIGYKFINNCLGLDGIPSGAGAIGKTKGLPEVEAVV